MIKVKGADKVLQKFKAMLDLTQNLQPVFQKIKGDESTDWSIRGSLSYAFKNEISPDDNAWDDLSPLYKKYKDKYFSPDLTILLRSGNLFESLVYGNSFTVDMMTNTKFVYGTALPYARTHQFGDSDKNVPKRPFMGFRRNQTQRINLEIRKYLLEAYRLQSAQGGIA